MEKDTLSITKNRYILFVIDLLGVFPKKRIVL